MQKCDTGLYMGLIIHNFKSFEQNVIIFTQLMMYIVLYNILENQENYPCLYGDAGVWSRVGIMKTNRNYSPKCIQCRLVKCEKLQLLRISITISNMSIHISRGLCRILHFENCPINTRDIGEFRSGMQCLRIQPSTNLLD